MKRLFTVLMLACFLLGGCVTLSKQKDYSQMAEHTEGKRFIDYDEDAAPLSTDIILKSAGGAGSKYVQFGTLAGLFYQAYDADLTTWAGITPSANAQAMLLLTYAQISAALHLDDVITLTGVLEEAIHLGSFTGSTITDNQTIKAAMQLLETALELRATLASPTLTGTVTIPTPFTIGAVSMASTGTQLNYLQSATGSTGTGNTNVVFSDSPTFTTDITIGTAEITEAEAGYLEDVTSSVQDQLDIRALESVVGTSLQANHLVKTGTVLTLTAEVALHDEANTWTAVQTFGDLSLSLLTGAPTPVAGTIYYADNATWDPCDIAGTVNYYVIYDGADYVALFDEDGVFYVSSIYTPTLIAATLNDTSTPHTLIQAEMESKYISNVSGAMHLDVLADAAGWGVIFMVEAAADYIIHPADSQTWYLNGTVLAADRTISNTAATIGESLTCISTGTYVFCKSTDADWVSAAE